MGKRFLKIIVRQRKGTFFRKEVLRQCAKSHTKSKDGRLFFSHRGKFPTIAEFFPAVFLFPQTEFSHNVRIFPIIFLFPRTEFTALFFNTLTLLKKVSDFLVHSRDVTYQTLPGRELFLTRESLVSDIPAGEGKTANLFLQCTRRPSLHIVSFKDINVLKKDIYI